MCKNKTAEQIVAEWQGTNPVAGQAIPPEVQAALAELAPSVVTDLDMLSGHEPATEWDYG